MTQSERADAARAYHQRTKHHLDRYAAGPSNLDWDRQPAAFREWLGTPHYLLPRTAQTLETTWAELVAPPAAGAASGAAETPAPLDLAHLGNLLQLSSAITAWKRYGESQWALRAHPSSGNLHPTETWVIAYWVDGLADGLYHYQARDHSLEWRASTLTASETPGLWLGFSSIPWREAWKYGERAFRYCQLDMGHVLAALAYAAALMGWKPRLANLDYASAAHCLGLDRDPEFEGVEAEEAEVIVAMHSPDSAPVPLPPLDWDEWSGLPSRLDPNPEYSWPVIEDVARATRSEGLPGHGEAGEPPATGVRVEPDRTASGAPASAVILKRRSAQAFDGVSVLPHPVFRRLLASLLAGGSPVWALWNLPARVHPILMVHRVEGLAPGLYFLPRSESGLTRLGADMRSDFNWAPADPELPLYRLVTAQAERVARTVSCHQDIASQCAAAFMFVAEFAQPIEADPAAWRHLHWEAGMQGHCLTLEAEAAGWRGTGIGCFFDDADHELLGLEGDRHQVVYHYAIGMPLEDARITTQPAYD